MPSPLIFLSYSRKDEREKEQLVTQLRVLQTAGIIDIWSDDRIGIGTTWPEEIDRALTSAAAAVLLVTADFLISDFIKQIEVPRLLQAHASRGLAIFPLIAKSCAWPEIAWLARMTVRPRNGKAIWGPAGRRRAQEELAAFTRELAAALDKSSSVSKASPAEARDDGKTKRTPMDLESVEIPCSAPCKRAIATIESAVRGARGKAPLQEAAYVLQLAIESGAPLYNDDRIVDCAHIYFVTATMLLRMLRRISSDSPTPHPFTMPTEERAAADAEQRMLVSIARTILENGSAAAGELTEASSDHVAWTLRYCFDEILFFAASVARIDKTLARVRAANDVARVMAFAIDSAMSLESKGSMTGRDWIVSCAGIYRYTAAGLMSGLETAVSKSLANRIANTLAIALISDSSAADENPYRTAWLLHHGFARAHALVS